MKTIVGIAVLALFGTPAVQAQAPQTPGTKASSAASSSASSSSSAKPASQAASDESRTDVYYLFTMGHLDEQQYELTGRAEQASESIEFYKKALALQPGSAVIMERLAEIYAKSQRVREAVAQAQEVLKIDPDNLSAHRLLARIYVRTLGDASAGELQKENLAKAVDQFNAILKLDPKDTSSALWLARLYRFENQHVEAEKILREVLRRDPDNGPALEQLSQLLIDAGRSQDAIDLLSQAAGNSASPDIYDLLGDAYSQNKEFAKAEVAYRHAVELDPDDPGHHHGLAQALLSQDKYAPALEEYKRLSELEPGTAENYLRMAQLYRRLGKFDESESSLMHAKQLSPGSLEVLYNEALLYEDQGRYNDAIKILNDAIANMKSQSGSEGNPSALAILYEQLGRAYREQENYPAAVRTFEEMGKLSPESHKRAQMLLIDTYRESHDIDRAITETKKALADSPKDQSLIVTLAMLYGEKADAASATKLLTGLLKGNDGDQEFYLDLAQVQERSRNYSDAERSAEKAEQLAKDSGDKETIWFMLGAIYERQKEFDRAEQEFRKVLEVNPNNASVLNYYGYMLADRGVRLDEAFALIQRAVTQDPGNGAYLDSLGWAYFKQGKLAEAEETLRKAADRSPHDPTVLGHLAEVYMKLGQTERAAALMERALAEWQRALPADYEPEKVAELDSQLKTLKRALAQKPATETGKPQ
ncbi:MAG TPA: tetratricopeptide repeat protein [Candidatus Acidoferrales bacterium]|nr:tetratricopeptide repeat protein [Candidatus Acidoferrales bacterium]